MHYLSPADSGISLFLKSLDLIIGHQTSKYCYWHEACKSTLRTLLPFQSKESRRHRPMSDNRVIFFTKSVSNKRIFKTASSSSYTRTEKHFFSMAIRVESHRSHHVKSRSCAASRTFPFSESERVSCLATRFCFFLFGGESESDFRIKRFKILKILLLQAILSLEKTRNMIKLWVRKRTRKLRHCSLSVIFLDTVAASIFSDLRDQKVIGIVFIVRVK